MRKLFTLILLFIAFSLFNCKPKSVNHPQLTGYEKLDSLRKNGEKSMKLDTVFGGFILGADFSESTKRWRYLVKNDVDWFLKDGEIKTSLETFYKETYKIELDCTVYTKGCSIGGGRLYSVTILLSDKNNTTVPCWINLGISTMIYDKYKPMEEMDEFEITGIKSESCRDKHFFKDNMEIIVTKGGIDYITLEYRYLPYYKKMLEEDLKLEQEGKNESLKKL